MGDEPQATGTQTGLDRLEAALDRVEPTVVRASSWAVAFFVLFAAYLVVASAAGLGR